MSREAILAAIDARFEQLRPTLQAKQAAYLRGRSRLAQGLRTHSITPADGAEVAPDRLDAKPGYQAESWRDIGGLPPKLLSCVWIDQYTAPTGPGYVVGLEVRIQGQLWRRSWNQGPETWREQAWHRVEEGADGG